MRGDDERSEGFFSYVRLETRIPADHPLRTIRELVDTALLKLSPAFDRLYAREGRPSIPPERLLRALLLQAFYTVRSERQLMEQLDYNLLFRWFVGLSSSLRRVRGMQWTRTRADEPAKIDFPGIQFFGDTLKGLGLSAQSSPAKATWPMVETSPASHMREGSSGRGFARKSFLHCRAVHLAQAFDFLRRALSVEMPVPAYICR